MAMRATILLSIVVCFPALIHADEAAPQPRRAAADPIEVKSGALLDRAEHLRIAADHLAKGGMTEEGEKLRQQVDAMEQGHVEALLAQKEKELDALRAEVDRLRKLTRREPQIEIAVQVFEASRQRLKESKVPNLEALLPTTSENNHQPRAVQASATVLQVVEALRAKDLIKVLAEPTMVTVSGRPAMFNAGGEFPIPVAQSNGQVSVEFRKFGTGVDAVPILLGDGKVRLEIRTRISEVDPTYGTSINGFSIPGLRERVVDTAAELRFGEVLVLNGPRQQKVESQADAKGNIREVVNEIETIVLVTPKQIKNQQPILEANGGYLALPAASRARK
jgi:Flp pilus assembly secretin CpaC